MHHHDARHKSVLIFDRAKLAQFTVRGKCDFVWALYSFILKDPVIIEVIVMSITSKSYLFWQILEAEYQVELSDHLKNCFK